MDNNTIVVPSKHLGLRTDPPWTIAECAAAVSQDPDCISEYFYVKDMQHRPTPALFTVGRLTASNILSPSEL